MDKDEICGECGWALSACSAQAMARVQEEERLIAEGVDHREARRLAGEYFPELPRRDRSLIDSIMEARDGKG